MVEVSHQCNPLKVSSAVAIIDNITQCHIMYYLLILHSTNCLNTITCTWQSITSFVCTHVHYTRTCMYFAIYTMKEIKDLLYCEEHLMTAISEVSSYNTCIHGAWTQWLEPIPPIVSCIYILCMTTHPHMRKQKYKFHQTNYSKWGNTYIVSVPKQLLWVNVF